MCGVLCAFAAMGCVCSGERSTPEGRDLPEYTAEQREWSRLEREDVNMNDAASKVRPCCHVPPGARQ